MPTYDFSQPIVRKHSWKWEVESVVDGHPVLPMSVSDTDFVSPREVTETLREIVDGGEFGYVIPPPDHREVFAEWQRRRHGWNVDPAEVVITDGLLATMAALLEGFTNPGDGVILFTPVYHNFSETIAGVARRPLNCELVCDEDNFWTLDLARYRDLCASGNARAVIVCNPHNPVGRAWKPQEIEAMVSVAQANGMLVISDEIHADFVFDGPFHPTLKLADDKNGIVTLTSGGKIFNLGGLFSAYAISADARLRDFLRQRIRKQQWHQNSFTAWGAYAAYKHGYRYRDELVEYIRRMQCKLVKALNDMPYPVKAVLPQATYLLWADFREAGWSADELQRFLVRSARLGFNRGDSFGPGGAGFARINCAVPEATIDEAIERLQTAFAAC